MLLLVIAGTVVAVALAALVGCGTYDLGHQAGYAKAEAEFKPKRGEHGKFVKKI